MVPLLSTLSLLFSAAPDPLFPPEVQIPFACGQIFTVSQAHDVGSHLQNDTWAWDFRMPEGIPIVAALPGKVRLSRGDSVVGGCDPKYARFANYVVLSHPNGFETQYLHFSRVVVHEGDDVKAGDLLGFSGSTGWACGSHLHFKVANPLTPGWNNPSVPARLAGYGDPERGVVITSPACMPDGPTTTLATAPEAQKPPPLATVAPPAAAPATGSSSPVQTAAPAIGPATVSPLPSPAPVVAPPKTADATAS